MTEFGHTGIIIEGMCLDIWGAGPFTIEAGGRSFRFEDSDMFGPATVVRNGDMAARQPGTRSAFWPAHMAWVRQGRRVEGGRCVYDPLRPTTYRRVGRQMFIVDEGDEGGELIDVTDKSEAQQ